MNSKGVKYEFSAIVWQYNGPGGWYFVSLPEEISEEIRTHLKLEEEGWGRLKVNAKVGKTEWKTAIWFDTKMNTYSLPLKSEIRKVEKLKKEENIEVQLWV